MNIKTKLLEEIVESFVTTCKQNTYFKVNLVSFLIIVSSFSFYLFLNS